MIARVTFHNAGKIYECEAGDLSLKPGDRVVVAADRGETLARVVCLGAHNGEGGPGPTRKVLRVAGPPDLKAAERNQPIEQKALGLCRSLVLDQDLPMKLLKAEMSLDGRQTTFYFSSEGRVDFRALVRDLAKRLRQRIEMRQVGVRDQAKLLGGVGPCGQNLCCASFLREFAPVSIKAAKKLDASLNPAKISGVCGKLMCCLNYQLEGDVGGARQKPCAAASEASSARNAASPEPSRAEERAARNRKGQPARPPMKKEKKKTLGEALDSESWNLP
ncbi:MAG: regulatory iron-sulfur-containing complex subunit RicT [Nitrospirota bacterium]